MLLLTLVSMDVEDLEEKPALTGEGAMEQDSQATHKLLKTDLTILFTGRREGCNSSERVTGLHLGEDGQH